MSQGSFNQKIRFLGQKVCPVARGQTDGQTHTKVNTEDTLSGFQEFFLQPIIKDRSNLPKDFDQMFIFIGLGTFFWPILDDRLKEKFMKPWKGVLCIHFRVCLSVCLSVCPSARGLQSTPFDLGT